MSDQEIKELVVNAFLAGQRSTGNNGRIEEALAYYNRGNKDTK